MFGPWMLTLQEPQTSTSGVICCPQFRMLSTDCGDGNLSMNISPYSVNEVTCESFSRNQNPLDLLCANCIVVCKFM